MDGVPDTSHRASCLTEELKGELLSATHEIRAFLDECEPIINRSEGTYPREIRDNYYLRILNRQRPVWLEKYLYYADEEGGWAISGCGLYCTPVLSEMAQDITDLQEICELARRFMSFNEIRKFEGEEPVDKHVHKRLGSTNTLLNIMLENIHSIVDRLQEEIEELKLRPPEIGGEAFVAAKQHFEESINGRV